MANTLIPNVNYFLVGLGIGSVVSILFAPQSGAETREFISKKTREGSQFARKKAWELGRAAEEAAEHGKEAIKQTKGQFATAIDVGLETYNREKSRLQVS